MSTLLTDDAKPAVPLPSISHMLLHAPLYAEHPFSDNDQTRGTLRQLRRDNFQIDAHCIYCKRESVFKTTRTIGSGSGHAVDAAWMLKPTEFAVELKCVRNQIQHVYTYFFKLDAGVLRKIGQWPSIEDIAGADIEKYRSLLKGGYFRELKMATGLASHGVGIGSFVYLRRIFERLIFQHHEELSEPVKDFATLRMDEKIEALKSVLPAALVANKGTYAILSKGLHELDEETCKSYFPVVRAAIIRILEQDYHKREAEKADQELSRNIGQIVQQLKN